MTTQQVADRFGELIKENKYGQIYDELYSPDAESIEPENSPGQQLVKGLDAIRKKGEEFNQMLEEMHSGYSKEPVVAGTHFSVAMGMDATFKDMGRTQMDEIAVYQVKDGKIIKEQFFY